VATPVKITADHARIPKLMSDTAILLINCPDRKGLVAAIANFLLHHNANILHADQHQDNELVLFFMRVEFSLEAFDLDEAAFRAAFTPIAVAHDMTWQLAYGSQLPSVAIFVSHYLHCLADLLYRHSAGELPCKLALIISNHDAARPLAEFHKTPFHHMPVTPANKSLVEQRQLSLLADHNVDLVILARYMQVLSPAVVSQYPRRIINVHHSFLPAFTGARPYHAAFARGVKLIGSTSHYVTEVLDDGPIIEQDVIRISHSDQLPDLVQKGRDLERLVLSRAVRWHLEHRILSYANKTVIFN
jgi:formyltetrahydrofolate deformylase